MVKSFYQPREIRMDSHIRETIKLGGIEVEFLVDADDSGGSVTVFECAVAAGGRVPAPHSHDGFEETIYGLDGITTWTIDGDDTDVGPGQAICIRRGQVHGFVNPGAAGAKFLAVAAPGVFGPDYFRDIADVVKAASGGPPDLEAVASVMRRHGLTPAKPVAA
jgi:quercetin dioxygenase-like cupin family protein